MPAYAPLIPLTNDPLAIVLLATPGAHGADEWDQCEAFWNNQLAALPEGSCLIPARGDAAGEGVGAGAGHQLVVLGHVVALQVVE